MEETDTAEARLQRALTAAEAAPVRPSAAALLALPKAHLHLHLTGAARPETIRELAHHAGMVLPEGFSPQRAQRLDVRERRGWLRFQRLYDTARSSLRSPLDLERILVEAALDDRRDGSVCTEVQVDPTGYASLCGGLVSCVERLVEAARTAEAESGIAVRLILAANRTRNPELALPVARLASRFAGDVVGFGLSNDERFGPASAFERAFGIIQKAGLSAVPHAGELRGAHSVRDAVEVLGADRLGHGVRAVEDEAVLQMVIERGVTLEVCPVSNVELGVGSSIAALPIRELLDRGARIALGADDPLLFGAQLGAVYQRTQEALELTASEMARLAAHSLRASHLDPSAKETELCRVARWLEELTAAGRGEGAGEGSSHTPEGLSA